MKKILILIALVLIGGAGYYFGFGSQKAAETLKAQVNTQLQTLQKSGFEIIDRTIEAKKEHFVIHYARPDEIAQYFRSQNIDISDEDSKLFHGLKIGVDLSYLEGAYSALSADLYPVAFPYSLKSEVSKQGEKNLRKISNDKLFLAHIDINKLFTSFKGYLKDVNTTFEDREKLTVISRGFTFEGSYNDRFLTSSSNAVETLSFTSSSGAMFTLNNLKGSYEQNGKSLYDFESKYHIDQIRARGDNAEEMRVDQVDFDSSGRAKQAFAASDFSLHIKSIHTKEPAREHYMEDITGKASLKNLSVAALDKMKQLDSNDTEGFNEAFKMLLSKGVTLKVDELSVKKVKIPESGKMADGFLSSAIVRIDKVKDFKQLEENPFALLDIFNATAHLEFSDAFYFELRKQPEFAIATILFTPVSKNGKITFDVGYKDGGLKINGKPLL